MFGATVTVWLDAPTIVVQKPACLMPWRSQMPRVMVSNRLSTAGSWPGTQW